MPSFADPRLVCRPALPSDTADVLEFTKFIWDGDDYIKYVWKEWLDDPQGILATAQYGAHAVGIAKITLLAPGQWWLEGLRVDPNFQGLKIGSHLHEYLDGWWLAHGDGIIRLMTSSERVQVHHLTERTGYAKIGEVADYRLGLARPPVPARTAGMKQSVGLSEKPQPLEPVHMDEVTAALAFALAHLSHSNGLMDSGWRFSTPDESAMTASARSGHLHWWRGRAGLLATFEDDEDGERVLGICFAAIDEPPLLSELLLAAGVLAGQQGFTAVHWLAPVEDKVRIALRQAGYATDWEHTGFLYAKRQPGG